MAPKHRRRRQRFSVSLHHRRRQPARRNNPTWVVALDCSASQGGAEGVTARMRSARHPVIARIEQDRVMLDPRTVPFDEGERLVRAVKAAL